MLMTGRGERCLVRLVVRLILSGAGSTCPTVLQSPPTCPHQRERERELVESLARELRGWRVSSQATLAGCSVAHNDDQAVMIN